MTRAGKIQRGAMIHGRTYKRQAKGDVNHFTKSCVLDHRKTLVVEHGDDHVECFQVLLGKSSISGQWPPKNQALGAQLVDNRRDDVLFLPAKMTRLARA